MLDLTMSQNLRFCNLFRSSGMKNIGSGINSCRLTGIPRHRTLASLPMLGFPWTSWHLWIPWLYTKIFDFGPDL